jgi:hypothetical protein
MPPFEGESDEGWIAGDRLARIPPQQLQPSEVEPYLDYLFGNVARRPKPIRLREGAAAARFLQELARQAPAGEVRQLLSILAGVIWRTVLQNAPFSMGPKEAVVELLRKHASTYLVAFDVEAAVKYVQEAQPPIPRIRSEAPRLLSRRLAVQADSAGQRLDDVSERIYAGYHALRRARVHKARRRIAEVLNRYRILRQPRGATEATWGSDEVMERVKQYEDGWKGNHPGSDSKALRQWRSAQVDRWLFLFHSTPVRQHE